MEDEIPVEEWKIGNILCWPSIRRYLFDNILKSLEPLHVANWKRKDDADLPLKEQALIASERDPGRNQQIDRHYHAVVTGCVKERCFVDGLWYDRQVDPVIELLNRRGLSSLHVEHKASFHVPRGNASYYAILNDTFIFRPSQNKTDFHDPQLVNNLDRLNAVILAAYPDFEPISYSYVSAQVAQIRHYADCFYTLFTKVRPHIGIVACYTSHKGFGFNIACRRYNIPSVAIQHGVAARFNPANARWPRVPAGGYPFLPKVFWCWDKENAKYIDSWNDPAQDQHLGFAGGDLWLDKIQNATPDSDSLRRIDGLMKYRPGSKYVLWIQQSLLPDNVDFMKQAPQDWIWWIRLHPLFMHLREPLLEMMAQAGVENFLIDELNDLSILILFQQVDVILTSTSTAVLEAMPFRTYSVITSEMGERLYSQQIKDGAVKPAFTTEEIIYALQEQAGKKGMDFGSQPNHVDPLGSLYELLGLEL